MELRALDVRTVARSGALAGLAGGALIHAYIIVQQSIATHLSLAASAQGLWQFIAAGAIGKAAAFSNPATAWLGLFVHFAVAIGWAAGYAYLARTTPQLRERPIISGIAFGLVVWLFMQIVLIGAGLFRNPSPSGLGNALIAHCLFYGVPVAYVVSRTLRV